MDIPSESFSGYHSNVGLTLTGFHPGFAPPLPEIVGACGFVGNGIVLVLSVCQSN